MAEDPEVENGVITEIAGPREERLADAAAPLFASRVTRPPRGGPLGTGAGPLRM